MLQLMISYISTVSLQSNNVNSKLCEYQMFQYHCRINKYTYNQLIIPDFLHFYHGVFFFPQYYPVFTLFIISFAGACVTCICMVSGILFINLFRVLCNISAYFIDKFCRCHPEYFTQVIVSQITYLRSFFSPNFPFSVVLNIYSTG